MAANHHDELISLIEYLYTERQQFDQVERLKRAESGGTIDDDRLWAIFRGLVNTRHPQPASENFLATQDKLLQSLIAEYGISTLKDTRPSPASDRIRLWLGDITTLAVDGIVNAANSQMLGCWVPGHHCIDNAIHTYAGGAAAHGVRQADERTRARRANGSGEGNQRLQPAQVNTSCIP